MGLQWGINFLPHTHMKTPKTARKYVTLTPSEELAKRIERLVEETKSNKNSLITAVLLTLSDEQIKEQYRIAVEKGLVEVRVQLKEDQRKLMALVSTMSPEKVQELLRAAAGG